MSVWAHRIGLALAGCGAVFVSMLFLANESERATEPSYADVARTIDLTPGSRRERSAGASDAAEPSLDQTEDRRELRREDERGPAGRDALSDDSLRPSSPGLGDRTSATSSARIAPTSSRTSVRTSPGDTPRGTGLRGTYVSFKSTLTRVPSLAGAASALTRLDPVIDFPAGASWNLPAIETFAATWSGWFFAPTSGHYVFVVGSHDGSVLAIDNATVVSQDGLHAYAEARGELDLAQGFHPILLSFFIDLVDEPGTRPVCRLLCAQPGQPLAVVPTSLLFPGNSPETARLPSITSATPQNARRGQTVTLSGQNFGPTPDANAVTFGSMPAVVQAASPSELTVVVPPGVDSGPILLTVGGQSAPAFPYTVGGSFGLDALFWRETDDVDVTSFLGATTRPPDDERILGPIQLGGPGAFGLSFPALRFRAELYGQIYIQNPGTHGFGLDCDAGARLWIDGQLVVEARASRAEGRATLQQGWHTVRIDDFTNLAGARLTLLHADPGQPLAPCPRSLLAPPPEVDAQTPPTIASVTPGVAVHIGDLVTIHGTGLSLGDGRLPRVLLRGLPLLVRSVSSSDLAVEIVAGALGGPLTVQVGPLVSPAVNLDVATSPDLLARAATVTRLAPGVPPPVIDGKGDDLAWQTVTPLGAFVPCFALGNVSSPLTQARVTYDGQNLYLVYQCEEPTPSKMDVVGKRHEDPVYEGDSVELFFSVGSGPTPYARLMVNPSNVTWTALCGATLDLGWNPPVTTSAAASDDGWCVEAAIPWASLGISCPRPGESHRVNLCRARAAGPDFTCWSQTRSGFIEPDNFGTWTFR